jgi:hypothetical protein
MFSLLCLIGLIGVTSALVKDWLED